MPNVVQCYRHLGLVQTDTLRLEVTNVLEVGFIVPVHNIEWVSPVIVNPKRNGKWRICTNYKKLNAATKRDYHPLPLQDIILEKVSRHEMYTFCDGYSGFYQIRIAEKMLLRPLSLHRGVHLLSR